MGVLPMGSKSRFAVLAVGCALLGAVGVALLVRGDYHWVEVAPGRLYRSGQLDGDDLAAAISRHGIRTVLNLRTVAERKEGDWYEAEAAAAARAGARLVDLPMERGKPPTPEQVAVLLALFDDPASRPVLLHCEHGVVRSAAVEGLFRREYLRESGPEAVERVETFGRDLATKYPEVHAFIRDYVPRPAAPGP